MKPRKDRAMTLIELILVMSMLLVLGGIVGPAVSEFVPGVRLSKAVTGFVAAAGKARLEAALTGRRHRVVIRKSAEPPSYLVQVEADPLSEPGVFVPLYGDWGKPVELPDAITFESTEGAKPDIELGEEYLEFSPDGTASEATISFGHERLGHEDVSIDPATGVARIVTEVAK